MLDSPLGKKTTYASEYQPDLLFAIPRLHKRKDIGIHHAIPFSGYDCWNAYELSWLNEKGKPVVALAEIMFPCDSKNIIESKSLKLYLNSFNNTKFSSIEEVQQCIQKDLSDAVQAVIQVKLFDIHATIAIQSLTGTSLDDIDVSCDKYEITPTFLETENQIVHEKLFSHLLKSNCLITGQPDWGSIEIEYKGKKISHAGLLKYIVSFRNHNEFAEPCAERIFMDIMQYCNPAELTIQLYFTRRGGLDINPLRTTKKNIQKKNIRLMRQ
jgi:7-cyano-7-deazaguanine reductase